MRKYSTHHKKRNKRVNTYKKHIMFESLLKEKHIKFLIMKIKQNNMKQSKHFVICIEVKVKTIKKMFCIEKN